MRVHSLTTILCGALLLPVALLAQATDTKYTAKHTTKNNAAVKHVVPLTEEERALHMLNRFTFGARPGDVDAVRKLGVDAWFEQQLAPEKIDDSACNKLLADYPALALKPADLLARYPSERLLQLVKQKKRPMPTDPMLAGIYEIANARFDQEADERKVLEADYAANPSPTPEQLKAKDDAKAAQHKQGVVLAHTMAAQLLVLPKEKRMAAFLSQPVADRIVFFGSLNDADRAQLLADATPLEREALKAMAASPRNINDFVGQELIQAKLLRAVTSERQLQEVMADFWFNHFNIYLYKDSDKWYLSSYEREAIRPRVLGKFKDLLLATAQDPAMLVYLDNWLSIGPNSTNAIAANKRAKGVVVSGLNENYGREVMELHTVSVNGGYSQSDVTNLSKILTGWTVEDPSLGTGPSFDPRKHEPGEKKWFGQTVKENGYQEGKDALLWLAAQPQTAHFISLKLAERFVADEPPASLVSKMQATYLKSGGDIREVLRTMVHSPEFFDPQYYRVKVKTPLEFVVSSLRATGTAPVDMGTLAGQVGRMGMPLYQMLPPTGYSMMADVWMNSNALVNRLNYSLSLANNRLGNVKFDSTKLLAQGLLSRPALAQANTKPKQGHTMEIALTNNAAGSESGTDEALALMERMLVGSQVSANSNEVIRQRLSEATTGAQPDATQTLNTITALVLGSPEFQLR